MTPQQLAAIVAVGDSIRANPVSWDGLSAPARATLEAALMPAPSFQPIQREYLSRWWLLINDSQLTEINSLCPNDTLLTARTQTGGIKYVCADLLSDALNGGRLSELLPVLRALTLTHFLPAEWPDEEGNPGVEIIITDNGELIESDSSNDIIIM